VRSEHEQQPEQHPADDIGHGVVARHDERGRNEHDPRGDGDADAREEVGHERGEHDRAYRMPARIRVVERPDVDRRRSVRPANVRPGETDLPHELERVGAEPRREPHSRRDGGPTPREHCAARHRDRARDEERGGIEVDVEQLDPPRSVDWERPPETCAGDDAHVRVRIETGHHVVDRPVVDVRQRAGEDESRERRERRRDDCKRTCHRAVTLASGAMDELVEVRRSRRARRWTLTVPWGDAIVLTVPVGMPESEIEAVLASHREWIARERAAQAPRLRLESRRVSEAEARLAARELVTMVLEEEAPALGVTYGQVQIRDQRTRWGSCSARGTLSFNWRLALAPFEVLDYVVVHELCHLREPNHSSRFWRLVASRRPSWRRQRDWLTVNGPELLAFRPGAY